MLARAAGLRRAGDRLVLRLLRASGRRRARNYGELIEPPRPMPAAPAAGRPRRRAGRAAGPARPVAAGRRRRRRLRRALRAPPLAAAPAARDPRPREGPRRQGLAGRRRAAPRAETLARSARPRTPRGARAGDRAAGRPRARSAGWLAPAPGRALEDHLYIVDPRGDWMMRVPGRAPIRRKLKRDLERLLRASAGWDRAGR